MATKSGTTKVEATDVTDETIPTDTDGDGEPDTDVDPSSTDPDEGDAVEPGESEAPAEGPEQRRRVATLAEALYPDEAVSDEAKEAVAPKADAAHA